MSYDQPFYVGLANPRGFRGVRNGYLPALEPRDFSNKVISEEKVEQPWSRRQWDTVTQLKAQVLHLSSKVNEMRAKRAKGNEPIY